MQHSIQLNASALRAESRLIWTLARRRVFSDSDADDVVQATHVVSLKPTFASDERRGPALRNAAKKVLLQRQEAARHRADREYWAAKPDLMDDGPEQVATRRERSQRLKEAMNLIPDSGGQLLLDRYFEKLSVKQIAKREGVSPSAMGKRIKSCEDQLGEILERQYGGRQQWMAALAPALASVEGSGATGGSTAGAAMLSWLRGTRAFVLGIGAIVAATALVLLVRPPALASTSEADSIARITASDALAAPSGAGAASGQRTENRIAAAPSDPVTVRCTNAATGTGMAKASVSVWHAPVGSRVDRQRIEEWLRDGLFDEVVAEFSQVVTADGSGEAAVSLGPRTAVICAMSGEHWGWQLAEAGRTDDVLVELRPDREIVVSVVSQSGAPVHGATPALSSLGYSWTTITRSVTGRNGHATLRHAGYLADRRRARGPASIRITVPGSFETPNVDTALDSGRVTLKYYFETRSLEVRFINAATSAPVDAVALAFDKQALARAVDGAAYLPHMEADLDPLILELPKSGGWQFSGALGRHLNQGGKHEEGGSKGWELFPYALQPHRVELNYAGVLDESDLTLTLALSPNRADQEAVEASARALSGILVDATGRPLPHVALGLRLDGAESKADPCTTDADGTFHFGFNDRAARTFELTLVDGRGRDQGTCSSSIGLGASKSIDAGNVAVQLGAPIVRGTVYDPLGAPIGGATVRCFIQRSEAAPTTIETATNSSGRFRIFAHDTLALGSAVSGGPSASDVSVEVRHPAWAAWHQPLFATGSELSVTLEPAKTLRGRVVLPGPIEPNSTFVECAYFPTDFLVESDVDAFHHDPPRLICATVDSNGWYTLKHLGSGSYLLRVSYYTDDTLAGSLGYAEPSVLHTATLNAMRHEDGGTIPTLDLRSRVLRCTVRATEDGRPVENASYRETFAVPMLPNSAFDGASYEIEMQPAGYTTLVRRDSRIRLETEEHFSVEPQRPAARLDFELERRPTYRVHLTSAISDRPTMDDIELRVEPLGSNVDSKQIWPSDALSAHFVALDRGAHRFVFYVDCAGQDVDCLTIEASAAELASGSLILSPPSQEVVDAALQAFADRAGATR